jgi:ferric-dicitrate binding protein FerR (iron transport regulator)
MKPADDLDLDRAHDLMMGVLDGECTDDERREFDELLALRPDLAADWKRMQRLQEVTVTMGMARPSEEVWDRYRRSVLHRAERGIAWTLIAIGAGVLAATSLWLWIESWVASDLPLYVKGAIGAVMVGGALLVVSILRERWHLSRRDPYSREVER